MKLTVVTAVRNAIAEGRREQLVRCIKSVAKIPVEHEHLIYDGASTDGTVDLLRELEETTPGLKVVSEPDTGIYNALNKGVSDAVGEWLYVLGCDDRIVRPNVVGSLLANVRFKDRDVIVSPVEYDLDPHYGFHGLADLRRLLYDGYAYCHQGVLARTAVIRRFGGFDERYRLCADGDLWIRMHLGGVSFSYAFELFANFASGGMNEQRYQDVEREISMFVSANLNLSLREAEIFSERRYLPWRKIVPFLFSRDLALRISAWHSLTVMARKQLGIMK